MSRSWGSLKFSTVEYFFLQLVQDDPTPKNMADRDNGDDKNGRKNQLFDIDSNAFESEDDDYTNFDVPSEDDDFLPISKKKRQRNPSQKIWPAAKPNHLQHLLWPQHCKILSLHVSLFLLHQSLSHVLDVGNLFCGSKGRPCP